MSGVNWDYYIPSNMIFQWESTVRWTVTAWEIYKAAKACISSSDGSCKSKAHLFLNVGMAATIWGKLHLISKFSLLLSLWPVHQPSSQPRAIPIPSITQAFVKVHALQTFPYAKLSGTGTWPLLNAVTPAEINASFKNSPFGRSLGIMHSIRAGASFSFHILPWETPLWHSWRIRGMRLSLVEQISSQFMMYFMMPSLGGVAFKGLSCIVSSLDADFSIFVLLEINSERGVPTCDVYSTRPWGHVINKLFSQGFGHLVLVH